METKILTDCNSLWRYSLRIYPQDQNTGGFFVAVFEKVKPMTVADRMTVAKDQGQSLSSTDIEAAQVQDETLVKSITTDEDVSTAATAATATDAATESQDGKTPVISEGDDSAIPSKRTAATEDAPAQPTKKAKKDVQAKKEAPFDLMAPDNPDLLAIK